MSYRISLLVLLTLFACREKSPEDAPQSYPLETARMVSHVSEGCARLDRSDSRALCVACCRRESGWTGAAKARVSLCAIY